MKVLTLAPGGPVDVKVGDTVRFSNPEQVQLVGKHTHRLVREIQEIEGVKTALVIIKNKTVLVRPTDVSALWRNGRRLPVAES